MKIIFPTKVRSYKKKCLEIELSNENNFEYYNSKLSCLKGIIDSIDFE